jgi:hypothetical protein
MLTSGSPNEDAPIRSTIDLMQRDIQALEGRLAETETILGRIVRGITEQLRKDSNAVPAWLVPLLHPPADPIVPLVDVASGHTIGRVMYSPHSQKPKKVVSTFFIKMEEDDRALGMSGLHIDSI